MKPGTPLPAALSGTVETRPVTIDRALFYLIGGTLEYLADMEKLEQTGTLTVEQAREALSEMLWKFYHEKADMTPIGVMLPYGGAYPLSSEMTDAGYLLCWGDLVLIADYPDLYAVIGASFNVGGEPAGRFRLPNMKHRTPVGTGDFVVGGNFNQPGQSGGAETHTLALTEIPSHSHLINRSTATGSGGQPQQQAGSTASTMATAAAGGGLPHNNMQPYLVTNWVIKAF